jgi:hypothetical protein
MLKVSRVTGTYLHEEIHGLTVAILILIKTEIGSFDTISLSVFAFESLIKEHDSETHYWKIQLRGNYCIQV